MEDKNYFVTFYSFHQSYSQHWNITKNHSLIKSDYINGSHNLFISPIPNFRFSKNNENGLCKYQKYGQFVNSNYIFQKNTLYNYYRRKAKTFSEEYNYMPETYIYPEDKDIIGKKFNNYLLNLNDLWLVKPPDKANGDGLSILTSLKDIKYKQYLITKYITNINLINGKKYDLRIYVLLAGIKPLRIYLYEEGLVRISTAEYKLDLNSIKNKFMHFTNTNVNRKNKIFSSPKHQNDKTANTWNLFMYKKFLKTLNIEWKTIRDKIEDIIIKAIISVYEGLSEKNGNDNLNDQSFFNMLGIDIMITDDFIPKLIEINFCPQMHYYNLVDKPIKSNFFVDTLNLIGITPYSRKTNIPLYMNFQFKDDIEEKVNNAYCELSRPRGDFKLIFPKLDNINKYKIFFDNISKEDEKFWKIIKSRHK